MVTPDPGIKKVSIPRSSLPPVSGANNEYVLRYRIVSEDKNRTSSWSKPYTVVVPVAPTLEYKIYTSEASKVATVIWVPTAELADSQYDVYLRWVGDQVGSEDLLVTYPWRYMSTVSGTTYSTIIPDTVVVPSGSTKAVKHLQVRLQTPTYPKELFTPSKLFETPVVNV